MERDAVVVERARGPWLVDTDGRRYLDAVSSLWATVHGHREPMIDAAIRAQLRKVAHSTLLGLANVPSIELAERLVKIAPRDLQRVFYSDSGSTAVEVALKMAFQRAAQVGEPQRKLFVRFEGAYHGDTVGAVSVGGIDLFHRIFGPLLFQSIACPAPYAYRRPDGMSEEQYAAFLEHSQATHPLGRVGSAEEVAELIFFLASPKAGWITGVSLPIDGGRHQTCAR